MKTSQNRTCPDQALTLIYDTVCCPTYMYIEGFIKPIPEVTPPLRIY